MDVDWAGEPRRPVKPVRMEKRDAFALEELEVEGRASSVDARSGVRLESDVFVRLKVRSWSS